VYYQSKQGDVCKHSDEIGHGHVTCIVTTKIDII